MQGPTGAQTLSQEFETAKEISQRTLDFMLTSGVVPNPQNFELFYTYCSRRDYKLNSALDQTLRDGLPLAKTTLRQIRNEHSRGPDNEQRLAKLGENLANETGEFVKTVHTAIETAQDFGASLDGVNSSLADCQDPEKLRLVLSTLTDHTKRMEQTNQAVESRLSDSQEQIAELQNDLQSLRTEVLTDPLTGIANRKQFDETLDSEVAFARDSSTPLCLFMVDIDNFKDFNDTYGHQIGDAVLKLVASDMAERVKESHIVALYGGEEFAVILPQTELDGGMEMAESIRQSIMGRELVKKSTGKNLGAITVSIGVSEIDPNDTADSLVGKADANLYAAKRNGRNQVVS